MIDEILENIHYFSYPLKTTFRGVHSRQGVFLIGPKGISEFAPFDEYGPELTTHWLSAAIEKSWDGYVPNNNKLSDADDVDRDFSDIRVNGIAYDISSAIYFCDEAGCDVLKIKMSGDINKDYELLEGIVQSVSRTPSFRLDANGRYDNASQALYAIEKFSDFNIDYIEQPCESIDECEEVSKETDICLAVDESLRLMVNTISVANEIGDAYIEKIQRIFDVAILKVNPLGGVRRVLELAKRIDLDVTISSAIDTPIGLLSSLSVASLFPERIHGLATLELFDDQYLNQCIGIHGGMLTKTLYKKIEHDTWEYYLRNVHNEKNYNQKFEYWKKKVTDAWEYGKSKE